jgi:hypothetical protein
MIHCVLRGAPMFEMSGDDAQYAVNFCTFSANTLPHIYEHIEPEETQNRDVNYKKRVLKIMRGMAKKAPDGTIKHRNLLQNCSLTRDQLAGAIETLKAEGCVLDEMRGRGKVYHLNEIDEKEDQC